MRQVASSVAQEAFQVPRKSLMAFTGQKRHRPTQIQEEGTQSLPVNERRVKKKDSSPYFKTTIGTINTGNTLRNFSYPLQKGLNLSLDYIFLCIQLDVTQLSLFQPSFPHILLSCSSSFFITRPSAKHFGTCMPNMCKYSHIYTL